MSHDHTGGSSQSRRPSKRAERHSLGAWEMIAADADYPAQLLKHSCATQWNKLYGIGNRELLQRPCLGLVCSIQCPGSVIIKTFDAIRELREAGVIVAGGFHSPMEKECLDFLLRGRQPLIICPPKHPDTARIPAKWRSALGEGRLVIISPFAPTVRRTTEANAIIRNEFVAALSKCLLVPHASAGGRVSSTAAQHLARGRALMTIDDEYNVALNDIGARPYHLTAIRSSFSAMGAFESG